MTPEQWQRISRLFDEASTRTGEEREAYLDSVRDEPDSVIAELRALLASHDEGEHALLDQPTLGLSQQLGTEAGAIPEHVGSYRIVREIGRGGMGIVYLAQRDDGQYEQDVALKVIRRGIDSDDARQRFLLERQLLARLQHPGIATLLDGGITDDGRPYFVLEYIDGTALLDYCDARSLPVDQRLRLFLRICDAVQYAHQALVVHRDLKPGNILVTPDGEPRLLDFGIAKLLDTRTTPGDAPHTQAGMSLLTPEYGAPEQLRGEPVTTAADVYALGVILYELISGRRPYEFESNSAVAIYEALVNTDPARPSSRLTRGLETARRHAKVRGTTPVQLARHLRGDLDVIAMTALAKDPARRYGSAGALGEDVRRFLDQRPIEARGDSVSYRAGKFLRRHKVAVGAAAIVVVSLLAGLATTLWQGRIAAREAAKAAAVSDFLVDMLSSANPDRNIGRDVTVREIVDAASQRLDERASADPQVEQTLRATLGETLRALGQYDQAADQYQRAIAISTAASSASSEATLRLKGHLGATFFDAGRIDEAEPIYRDLLATSRAELGNDHAMTQEALVRYGGIHFRRGELADAETLLTEAVEIGTRTLGPDHSQTLTARSNLAASIARQGRLDEAAGLLSSSLDSLERVHGEHDRRTLVTMDNLANLNLELGNTQRAIELNERAVSIRTRLLEADHPSLLESRSRLAGAYHAHGREADALELFDKVLPDLTRVLGETHAHTLLARGNRALVVADIGDREGALAELDQVVTSLTATLGEAHPLTRAMRAETEAVAD